MEIGDGSKINLWTMPWIRNLPSHKPSTPMPAHHEDLTVNYLLNLEGLSWNQQIVTSIFNPQDAAAILSIPLHNRLLSDTRIWKTTTTGNYTVKSAYRICSDLLHPHDSAHNNSSWMNIWNLNIPHRVRAFLWRLAHNCLPTRVNLNARGIQCEESCVMFENFAECHTHLFFVCAKAMDCWKNIGLHVVLSELLPLANNFTTLLFDFMHRLCSQQQQAAGMLLWSLWKSRNIKLWDSTDTTTAITISRAKDTLHEWSCMQSAKTQPINPNHHISWVKPTGGMIKCNMDAAIFQNNVAAGYGICCRNSEDELLLGKSAIIHSSLSVLEAEAIVLLEAMKLSISSGFHHVYYETDRIF
uniref:Polynucleotidyl transferase, Ribonuclease H fold n=1 Tax=Medicago truncatula TaxID=3880 RepID=A2Q523_MEDTR|nr:Polynucleotidyl transferase, Ribonuclease H fold [Medicago truncatula]